VTLDTGPDIFFPRCQVGAPAANCFNGTAILPASNHSVPDPIPGVLITEDIDITIPGTGKYGVPVVSSTSFKLWHTLQYYHTSEDLFESVVRVGWENTNTPAQKYLVTLDALLRGTPSIDIWASFDSGTTWTQLTSDIYTGAAFTTVMLAFVNWTPVKIHLGGLSVLWA